MYASQRIGVQGRVLSIDVALVDRMLGANVTFLQGDALSLDNEALRMFAPYDVVLSDMAPSTTGNPEADAARSAELYVRAVAIAEALVKPGGAFVGKLFMGGEFEAARARTREVFEEVRVLRPQGTRTCSVEVFLVAMRRRPA